jgi:hypothetical protein
MKHLLILCALLVAASSLQARSLAGLPTQEDPKAAKEAAKKAKKARRQKGPEVYKGTVAEQNRLLEDAAGAQKDPKPSKDEVKAERKSEAK